MTNLPTHRSISNTLRYTILGAGFGFLFPVVATILRVATLDRAFSIDTIRTAHATEPLLWIIDSAPLVLATFAAIAGVRQDRLAALNQEVSQKNLDLERSQATLEQRVQERTLALEKQSAKFQFMANTARRITLAQDVDSLLDDIVLQIGEQFKKNRSAIYLLNSELNSEILILAATDNPQQDERILVDANTIAGAAALLGETRVISDVATDNAQLERISHLEAGSEIAIPLQVREKTIGVLHIQNPNKFSFGEEEIDVLTMLASQVAAGINNTKLYNEAKTSLAASRATIEQYVHLEWKNFNKAVEQTGFIFDGRQVSPLNGQIRFTREKSIIQTGGLSLDKKSANVSVPIKLRGLTIGILEVRSKKGKREWTDDELSLLEAAADRAAFALENARLVNGAQRRASRERAIGEIANRIGAISDRNTILQTAVEELGRRIGNAEVTIELESNVETSDE